MLFVEGRWDWWSEAGNVAAGAALRQECRRSGLGEPATGMSRVRGCCRGAAGERRRRRWSLRGGLATGTVTPGRGRLGGWETAATGGEGWRPGRSRHGRGASVRLGVLVEVAHGDDAAAFFLQDLQVGFEEFGGGADPGVLDVGDAVKGHHGDFSIAGHGHGGLELLEGALGFAVEGLGEGEGVVFFRIKGPRSASPGIAVAPLLQDLHCGRAGLVGRVAEGGGAGDAVRLTLLLNVFDVGGELGEGLSGHPLVPAGVVADLEARLMQFLDLLPSHVVLLVGGEFEAFGDIESGPESIFLEEGRDKGRLAGHGVVEGQDDDPFGLFFLAVKTKDKADSEQGDGKRDEERVHGFHGRWQGLAAC